MAKDITCRQDIITLVNTFYERVQQHPQLGYVFNTVAQVHWDTHLPKMYDFWENTLFGARTYKGNPLQPHLDLHQQYPLTETLFQEWLQLFQQTVGDLFAGPVADRAITRVQAIARMMVQRIHSDSPFQFTEK